MAQVKLSKHFGLGKSQFELDFIDINPNKDTRLFLDPHLIGLRNDNWSIEANKVIETFFSQLLSLLRARNKAEAKKLFLYLKEPNETCLGLSRGHPRGAGVGPKDTEKIFENLAHSAAITSGLVEDIEDCVMFVDRFGPDKLSDMTTNIIRKSLLAYTADRCNLWKIPVLQRRGQRQDDAYSSMAALINV